MKFIREFQIFDNFDNYKVKIEWNFKTFLIARNWRKKKKKNFKKIPTNY